MTETRFSLPGIILAGVVGLVAGLALGAFIGFVLMPLRVTNVDVSDLKPREQEEYIILVADAFSYDLDLPLARQRLAKLNDKDVKTRVGKLATSLQARDDVTASRLAGLAIALGASDTSLRVLASKQSAPAPAGPTKFAQLRPSATPLPTETEMPTAVEATSTPVVTPTATKPAGPTGTPRPTQTRVIPTATANPVAATTWLPDYPSQWWPSVKASYVDVPAGTKYWHLTRALYCDREDKRNNCQDLPGGENDYSIYVLFLDESGKRVDQEALVQNPDGTVAGEDVIGPQKSASDMCNCNYAFQISNYAIKGKGLPSDTISGFCACSINSNWSARAHVRYFLTFQLKTR